MAGKVTFSILQEGHEGPIGDDWRYWIQAKVYNEGLKGEGTIKVEEHILPTGVTQEPPGPPAPVEIPAGKCGQPVKIKLHLEATEVDVLINDVGETSIDLMLPCPGEGEDDLVHETEVSVGVIEAPGITGESSIFTLKVRLVLSSS